MNYSTLKCEVCRVGAPPASDEELAGFAKTNPDWRIEIVDSVPQCKREFTFPNFLAALDFTVEVGKLAESEGHHPAILTEWGKVTVSWWTHKINNVHKNDLIMAAKTDQLYKA